VSVLNISLIQEPSHKTGVEKTAGTNTVTFEVGVGKKRGEDRHISSEKIPYTEVLRATVPIQDSTKKLEILIYRRH